MSSSSTVPVTPPPSATLGAPTRNAGHGQRLTMAFDALEAFPALASSRQRLLDLAAARPPSVSDLVGVIESDVALAVAVLRLANTVDRSRDGVDSIVRAVEVLTPETISEVARRLATFDFFERPPVWDAVPERFRLHAVSVQRAADRLAVEADHPDRDRLLVTALLHDIGKLVLTQAYPGYPKQVMGNARTPEERLHMERRELGVDHAMVGGVLARRWNLPKSIASGIERHHAADATGDAALIRLADIVAHYSQGLPVSPAELKRAARAVGFGRTELRRVLHDLPYPAVARVRATDPCPLSAREMDVLKLLSKGMVYKQIAQELHLSTSTVRTHLHNVYGKLGAVDRAQAVLHASQRGWL